MRGAALPSLVAFALAMVLAASPAVAGDGEGGDPPGGPPAVKPGSPPPEDEGGEEDEPDDEDGPSPAAAPRAEEKPRIEAVRLANPEGLFHLYNPPGAVPLRSRPLLLLLHAEREPAATAILELVPEAKRRGWILAAPESRALQWRNPDGDILLSTLDAVAKRLAVDPDRVILAGAGSGGLMATRWGLENAARFGAIAAHGGAVIPDLPKKPKDLPVFLSVGGRDEEWRGAVPEAVEALREAGIETGTAVHAGLGHEDRAPEVWTRAFDFLDGALGSTRRRLDRAERARKEKRWADAWAEGKAVEGLERERARLLDAAKEIRTAEMAALDLVKKARDLARRDPEAGRRRLEELKAAFPGSAGAGMAELGLAERAAK